MPDNYIMLVWYVQILKSNTIVDFYHDIAKLNSIFVLDMAWIKTVAKYTDSKKK